MKNTFVKVLSFLMALTMIVGMFGVFTVAADTCAHVKASDEPVKDVAPTCAKPGFKSYICALCGQEFIPDAEVILPSAEYHNIQKVDPVEASCITGAYTGGQRCVNEDCPDVESTWVGVEPLGGQKPHSFKKNVVAATCTTDARVEYVCTTCNYTAEEIVEKKFDWVADQKYEDWACEVDEGSATDKNHEKLEWVITAAPVKGSATAICAAGSAKGVCASCGLEKVATLPAPHEYTVKLNPTGSTCSDYKGTATACKHCGQVNPNAERWDDEEKTNHGEGTGVLTRYTGDVDALNLPYRKAEANKAPVQITLAELREIGLDDGSPMYVAPTCTTVGYQLIECVCRELVYVELPALGHDVDDSEEAWDNVSEIQWARYCTEDSVKVQVCGRKNGEETCEYQITKVVQPKVNAEHPYTVTTKYATCDTVGYKTGLCEVEFYIKDGTQKVTCGHTKDKYDFEDALGHKLGAVQLKEGAKCTDEDGYEQVCQNVDRNNENAPCTHSVDAARPTGAAHSYGSWETVPGTCLTKSYQKKTCSKCNDVQTNASFTGAFNAANHEYVHVSWESDKAPTCTTGAVEVVKCKNPNCSDTLTTRTVAANTKVDGVYNATHKYDAVYAEIVDKVLHLYGVEGTDTKTVNYHAVADATNEIAKAATCQADGYKNDGAYCVNCGAQKTAATKITKESVQGVLANHVDPRIAAGELKASESGTATCQAKAWAKYNTSCCGIIKIESGDLADCAYELVAFKAPTCTAAGNHAHYACKWCKTHQAGSIVLGENPGEAPAVVEAPEAIGDDATPKEKEAYETAMQAYKDYVDAKAAYDAKVALYCPLDCSNHNAIAQKVSDKYTIAALGHDMETKDAEKAKDCLSTGKAAYEYCKRCDVVVFNGKTYNLAKAAEKTAFEKDITIPAHYNTYKLVITEETKVDATCTTYGTKVGEYCTVCDAAPEGELDPWVEDYAAHKYNEFKVNPEGDKYDCTKASATVKTCMVCGDHESSYFPAENPNGHDYKKYTVGKLTNQEWSDTYLKEGKHCTDPLYKKKECKDCKHFVEVVAEEATGHWTTKGVVGGTKYTISLKCNEYDNYLNQTCGDCGWTVTEANVPKALKREHTPVTQIKAATCTTDGYKITFCSACNDEDLYSYEKVAKLTSNDQHTVGDIIELVPASATVAGHMTYVCTECTKAAKEVDADAADVVVTDVIPATAVLTPVLNASVENVAAGEEFTVTYAYAGKAETIKSLEIDVDYDSTKLAFVKAEVNADLEGLNIYYADQGTKVGVVLVVANDSEGNERTVTTSAEGTVLFTLTFVAKKTAYGEASIEGEKVTVNALGDLNDDGILTSDDAYAIYNHITTQTAYADVNLDGMVSVEDVEALAQFIAAGKTVAAYLEMIGESADVATVEDEVFALLTAGRLNDINNDKFANETDAYKLIEMVKAYLAKDFNVLGDMTTLADVVATVNANPAV